jgi:hypothetical protein
VAVLAAPPWRPAEDRASVGAAEGSGYAASAQDRERVGIVPGRSPGTQSNWDEVCWRTDRERGRGLSALAGHLAVWKRAVPRNRMREIFTSGSVGAATRGRLRVCCA